MLGKVIFGLLLAFCAIPAYAQIEMATSHIEICTPAQLDIPDDPSTKNLTWYTLKTENFTVVSLSRTQAEYMRENLEKIKTWCITRWGLKDVTFAKTVECRIFCVPNAEWLEKLFRLKHSYVETRFHTNHSMKMTVVWLHLDGNPVELLPPLITFVTLKQMELQYKINFSHWVYRGMAGLNGSLPQIRQRLGTLHPKFTTNQPMFWSKSLFTMSDKDRLSQQQLNRDLFDVECMALCLLLLREGGDIPFKEFMGKNSTEANLRKHFGFSTYEEFDPTLKRYMTHLSEEVVNQRTPDTYLQITCKKEGD